MAGYGGYFLKGLAGGIESGFNMASRHLESKWKKDEEKKLKAEQEAMMESVGSYMKKVEDFGVDGFSVDEGQELKVMFLAGGSLFQEEVGKTHEAIQKGLREETAERLETLKLYSESLGNSDPKNFKEYYDEVYSQVKGTKHEKYFVAYNNSKQKEFDAKEKARLKTEKYATLKEFHGVYKEGTPYEHDKEGYIMPKYLTQGGRDLTDYQRKRANIQSNVNLTEAEKARGIYKLDTGIDIGGVNDDNDDFTTAEGKRTMDLAFTIAFGYTAQDGTKIAGVIPSRLIRQLSMGRKATEKEKEEVLYDWSLRKATTLKLGGKMAVKAIEDIFEQLFREIKPEEIVKDSLLEQAGKYIDKLLDVDGTPTGETTPPKPVTPTVGLNSKMALIPSLTNDELKKQANAAAQEDINSELYAALYEECKKRGLFD